jgi:hypothetical protein
MQANRRANNILKRALDGQSMAETNQRVGLETRLDVTKVQEGPEVGKNGLQ